jgi:hypothetical protein
MESSFELLVDPGQAPRTQDELNRLDGIHAHRPLPRDLSTSPFEGRHLQQLPLQDLAPLLISVASTVTSFLALATALFKLKAERAKASAADAKDPPRPVIIINQEVVVLADFASPQELAAYLQQTLQP